MFEKIEVGTKIEFDYVDREELHPSLFPEDNDIKYEVEKHSGVVVGVRDTKNYPLSYNTIKRKSNTERSRYLLRVQLKNGQCRSFYHNRMTNVKIRTPRKSFIGKIVDKLVAV